jgi:type III pantothenate kinase
MATTLCFDFGNTRGKYAVFSNAQIIAESVLDAIEIPVIETVVNNFQPQHIILCSVIAHNPAIDAWLAAQPGFLRLDATTPLPIRIAYESAATLGPDRIALAVAAQQVFPGNNNLIIGLGTCITYNFINQQGVFLGGAISPGLYMRFRAMHEFTGKLPLAEPSDIFPLIGFNTRQSLVSGVMNGIVAEIKGTLDAYSARYANFNAVLTGGDIVYFAPLLKNKIFADPLLMYKGLYAISEYNYHGKK